MAHYVVGVSIGSLTHGSPVSLAILSTDDSAETEFFHDELKVDVNTSTVNCPVSFALTCTLKRLVAQLSSPRPTSAVYALPLHPSIVDQDIVHNAANAADLPVEHIVEEIGHCLFDLDAGQSREPWHELILLVTPFYAAAELCAAEVVELHQGQYMPASEVIQEVLVKDTDISTDELFQQLVQPLLTAAQSADVRLERVVVISTVDAFQEPFVNDLEEMLQVATNESIPAALGHPPAEFAARVAIMSLQQNSSASESDSDSDFEDEDDYPFSVVDARIGIARSDGFVCTLVDKNCSVPTVRSIFLTTSHDMQASATVTVVVGSSLHLEKNTSLGTFKLRNLTLCGKAESRIKITGYVGHDRVMRVVAEELLDSEKGTFSVGALGSVEFVRPAETFSDDAGDNIFDAEIADREWEGRDARGALPE